MKAVTTVGVVTSRVEDANGKAVHLQIPVRMGFGSEQACPDSITDTSNREEQTYGPHGDKLVARICCQHRRDNNFGRECGSWVGSIR